MSNILFILKLGILRRNFLFNVRRRLPTSPPQAFAASAFLSHLICCKSWGGEASVLHVRLWLVLSPHDRLSKQPAANEQVAVVFNQNTNGCYSSWIFLKRLGIRAHSFCHFYPFIQLLLKTLGMAKSDIPRGEWSWDHVPNRWNDVLFTEWRGS